MTEKYKPAKRVKSQHRSYKKALGLPISLRDFVREMVEDPALRNDWFAGKKAAG